jgi:single-strand DNA-binding protein
MEITGRITADAVIKNLTDGRKLVSFDLAINDYYQTRTGEKKEVATFFDCSYWITTKIAQYLTKGSIVAVYGRIGFYAYKDKDGNPHGALQFHVNNIRFIAQAPKAIQPSINQAAAYQPQPNGTTSNTASTQAFTPAPETIDDLPF